MKGEVVKRERERVQVVQGESRDRGVAPKSLSSAILDTSRRKLRHQLWKPCGKLDYSGACRRPEPTGVETAKNLPLPKGMKPSQIFTKQQLQNLITALHRPIVPQLECRWVRAFCRDFSSETRSALKSRCLTLALNSL